MIARSVIRSQIAAVCVECALIGRRVCFRGQQRARLLLTAPAISSRGRPEADCSMVVLDQDLPRAVPHRLGSGGKRALPQPLEQRTVVVKRCEVLGEGVDVACAVDEGVLHVTAKCAGGIRDERHAAAADGLGANQRRTFLKARQDEQVARPHEVGKVIAVPENPHAWVRKQFESRSRYAGTNAPAIKNVPVEDAGDRSHASSARCRPLRTAATPAKRTVSPDRCGRSLAGGKKMDGSKP